MNDDDKNKLLMSIMPVFILLAMMMSTVNLRADDIRDSNKGSWTLPLTLALTEIEQDQYLAIGNRDRFTQNIVKPEQ